jgi:hypothetical protein
VSAANYRDLEELAQQSPIYRTDRKAHDPKSRRKLKWDLAWLRDRDGLASDLTVISNVVKVMAEDVDDTGRVCGDLVSTLIKETEIHETDVIWIQMVIYDICHTTLKG